MLWGNMFMTCSSIIEDPDDAIDNVISSIDMRMRYIRVFQTKETKAKIKKKLYCEGIERFWF